jgi:hypothetical protein
MRLAAVVLAVAGALAAVLAGCWTERPPARPPPSPGGEVPGTLWITPKQPWRASAPPRRIAAAGGAALLVQSEGLISRFDLAHGEVVRERVLGDLAIEDVIALPGGGWLAVGRKDQHAVAVALDAATLEPREVVTGIEGRPSPDGLAFTYAHANGAVVLDEGVAIAGQGLPLAIYDPVTWKIRRIVDPVLGWSRPAGAGTVLYAYGKAGLRRFDLATGGSAPAGSATYYLATARHLITRARYLGSWVLDIETAGQTTRLPVGAFEAALDPIGERLAIRDGAAIRVFALAGGAPLGTYDLGDAGHGGSWAMAFDGGRLVVSVSSVVRVIDLATGAMTPAGAPPYGPGEQLALGADSAVRQLGTHLVRISDGRLVASTRLEYSRLAVGSPHDVARYGVVPRGDERTLEVRAVDTAAPVSSWRASDKIFGAWLGGAGDVVIHPLGFEAPPGLYRGSRGRLEKLLPLHHDATVHDVDVDLGFALVARKAAMHLVRLAEAASIRELPHPNCEEYVTAALERGGDRIQVRDGDDLAIYRRTTGALVAAAHVEGAGEAVFVRGRDELLIAGRQAVRLWNTATGELRTQPVPRPVTDVQVSPDGRRAALLYGDGRIALVDLGVLRAAMAPGRATAVKIDPTCERADPLEVEPLPEDIDIPDPPGGAP